MQEETQPAVPPLLEVDDLSAWFPTALGVVHAVDDLSFSVQRGETVGIVGESGSGKSVLARSIMRLLPRSAVLRGSVRFESRDLLRLEEADARKIWGNDIAMVFQNPMTSLNPVVRIGRQITESLRFHLGLTGTAARARAVELLDMVGIPDARGRLDVYPQELSGGMRQRVCIAIAIACSPKLLIADEPTTALDVTIQHQILDLLAMLQRDTGMALMLITHDLGVVAGRTDRVLVMYGGRVVESGATSFLFCEHRHPYTEALLAAVPRIEQRSHTRMLAIPGRPVDVVDPTPSCRFAPRCPSAQKRCMDESPELVPSTEPGHAFACFYPVGSAEGAVAIAANRAQGCTPAGLELVDQCELD
jgi:peptide/nickel transport system ATP-binding protein